MRATMNGHRNSHAIRRSLTAFVIAACAGGAIAPPPVAAQNTPPAAETTAPAAPDAGARSGAPAPASDEDLEAAVLGGQPPPGRRSTPPAPPPVPAPARPPLAGSPPLARRPPERSTQLPVRRGDSDAEEDGRAGAALAIELGASGFAAGALQGGLFLGARLASGLIVGGALDYASSSVSVTDPLASAATEQSSSTLRLGAGARYPVLHSEDDRAELFLAAGLGLVRVSSELPTGLNSAQNYTASGPTVAAGPGLRFWVHERIAIGYVAQFRVTHLSGKAGAFADVQAGNPQSDVSTTAVTLEGTFQLLGVF